MTMIRFNNNNKPYLIRQCQLLFTSRTVSFLDFYRQSPVGIMYLDVLGQFPGSAWLAHLGLNAIDTTVWLLILVGMTAFVRHYFPSFQVHARMQKMQERDTDNCKILPHLQ